MQIRLARVADSEALRAVYAQYIDTSVTFEYELPGEEAFARRIGEILSFYPYLAAEENGRIVGYAYAHRCQERPAYQWNAELSVYLERAQCGRGLGGTLYAALLELLRLQGIRTVYGVVTSPNEPSERLHRSMGFRCAGVLRHAGYKCGAWHDVTWFEKSIAPYGGHPAPPVPLSALGAEKLESVLLRCGGAAEP